MAAPPAVTEFKKDDFPDSGLGTVDVLDKLFLPLNSALSGTRSALSGKLTFGDNFLADIKEFNVVTPSTGTGVLGCFPLAAMATRVTNPMGVILLGAFDLSGSLTAPSLGVPSWAVTKTGLQITNIPGLLLGRTYKIRLLVLGG